MKRDFDLVRKILLEIEAAPIEVTNFSFNTLEGYDDMAVVNEHIDLLIDAGLVKGAVMRGLSGIVAVSIQGLTWKGYDFIDAAKDDSIWTKAKETVLKPTVAITFGLLLDWLKQEAKMKLGLP